MRFGFSFRLQRIEVATVPFSLSPSFSIFPCVLWIGIHSGTTWGLWGGSR
ncbi:unnamed protein product [Penicillium roqueforti FM164]|uniref:Genomic scaffold, ProqFM164S01 n=1 Tax=Penicillium roqueforti (strain FM164) TaxID=1365484 RepID=W6Q078_PENRF|nr:unnamed protein product [Penicillium roqueforti FM164]